MGLETRQNVLVTPRSTSMQFKSTKNITEDTKTMETSEKLRQKTYQDLISWLEAFLARLFLLQENVGAFEIHAARSFLKSLGLLGKNSHAYYCLRTSKGFYLTTKDVRSLPSSPRLMNWGMTSNGKCLTARISASHKTENECSLSDILEEQVDQKYFLSSEATQKILNKF